MRIITNELISGTEYVSRMNNARSFDSQEILDSDRDIVLKLLEQLYHLEVLKITDGIPISELNFCPEATELSMYDLGHSNLILLSRIAKSQGCTIQQAAEQLRHKLKVRDESLTKLKDLYDQCTSLATNLEHRDLDALWIRLNRRLHSLH